MNASPRRRGPAAASIALCTLLAACSAAPGAAGGRDDGAGAADAVTTTPAGAPDLGGTGEPASPTTLPAKVVTWTNPTVTPGLPDLGGHADLQNVPEGLMRVDGKGEPNGTVDPKKPTVIFIHGWTSTGQATHFPSPATWNDAGWNTFIFRWHRRSYDPALVPLAATKRIPAVADELALKVKELRAQLDAAGGADQELRIVGHSLGAILGTRTASKVFEDSALAPRRLELLDPAYLNASSAEKEGAMPSEMEDELTVIGEMLDNLSKRGTKAVVYATVVSRLFAQNTWSTVSSQWMSVFWQGALSFEAKHVGMIPYYFDSLAVAPRPAKGKAAKEAFSASFPTAAIEGGRVLRQSAGTDTVEMSDDEYTED